MSSNSGEQLKNQPDVGVHRTSGMLLAFSVFLLVEGTIRVTLLVGSYHDSDWDAEEGESFPAVALLAGGVIQILAGVVGLMRALGVMMFDYVNASVTRFAMNVILLAWFSFAVFVFVEPAFKVVHADVSTVPGLDLNQYREVLMLGMLGESAYSGALLSGQAFFAWELWAIEKGKITNCSGKYYIHRLAYYSILALVGGLSQLAIGTIVEEKVGVGKLIGTERIAVSPYVIVYPELCVIAGLVVAFSAVVGLGRAIFPSRNGRSLFCGMWLFSLLVQIAFMAATQLGLWDDGTVLERREVAYASGLLVVYALSLSILPPYMDAMLHRHKSTDHGQGPAAWV